MKGNKNRRQETKRLYDELQDKVSEITDVLEKDDFDKYYELRDELFDLAFGECKVIDGINIQKVITQKPLALAL